MKWEMFHGRSTSIDQLTVMRLVFQASDQDDDMSYILKNLFMLQRSGQRTKMPIRSGAERRSEKRERKRMAKEETLSREIVEWEQWEKFLYEEELWEQWEKYYAEVCRREYEEELWEYEDYRVCWEGLKYPSKSTDGY